ncbi:MAG: GNAT family N-acetyltransferase [Pyrinomonadaceae bacterium]
MPAESEEPRANAGGGGRDGETQIVLRECTTIDEFDACVRLQREAFGLPDLELSPRRHLIVSRAAGGWVLGAFAAEGEMVGFVLNLAAARGDEPVGYSHMMAVAPAYQNRGVGARLKWAQRERALAEGRRFIKWTWDPMQARNAHFNINRLGAVVRAYAANFYGTDYNMTPGEHGREYGIDSDRLFAEWELNSPRVEALARGEAPAPPGDAAASVEIPPDWGALLREDPPRARREQLRVRDEFQRAFAQGLVCAGFERDTTRPRYLFYCHA